jgi:hypothetical protein
MKNLEISVDLSAGPDPLPKEGDTVNYVQAVNKIIPAKVFSVCDKTEGRTITVLNPDPKAKGPVRVTHRPRAAIAGNTWHWPAKAAAMLLLLACLAIALAMPARAGLPTYNTKSGYGNATYPATVIFPADPHSQIRLVSLFYSTDANTMFAFSSGNTAYSVLFTNNVSSVTNLVDSTNGLATSALLVLQHAGIDYTNSVSSWGTYDAGTNTSGYDTNQAFIVTPAAFSTGATTWNGATGDNIYLMTAATPWFIPTGTNQMNGDDIFSGTYGRPVMVQLGPSSTTNRIYLASSHYDSASQP